MKARRLKVKRKVGAILGKRKESEDGEVDAIRIHILTAMQRSDKSSVNVHSIFVGMLETDGKPSDPETCRSESIEVQVCLWEIRIFGLHLYLQAFSQSIQVLLGKTYIFSSLTELFDFFSSPISGRLTRSIYIET